MTRAPRIECAVAPRMRSAPTLVDVAKFYDTISLLLLLSLIHI